MYTRDFIEINGDVFTEYIVFVADCLELFLEENDLLYEYKEFISKWSDSLYDYVRYNIVVFGLEWKIIADGFDTEEMNEEFISFMKSKNNGRFDLESIYH